MIFQQLLLIGFVSIFTLAAPFDGRVELASFLDSEDSGDASIIADSFLVTLKQGATVQNHLSSFLSNFAASDRDVRILHTFDISEFQGYAVQLGDLDLLDIIRSQGDVEFVEYDRICSTAAQQVGAQWNLARLSSRDIPETKDFFYPDEAGEGVDIYILDTGVRTTHSEFGGRARWGTSFTDESNETDNNGHGTHVAGIAAGSSLGVAKKANIVAVQVLNQEGYGKWSSVIAALDWVYSDWKQSDNKAVVNLSVAGSKSSTLNLAVRGTIKNGIHVVVAAGNDGLDACERSPASEVYAVTVGSIGQADGMSSFSNVGPCVDVFAPGEAILSAYHFDDSSTAWMTGTSMAAPHVSGVKALMLSTKVYTVYSLDQYLAEMSTKGKINNLEESTVDAIIYVEPPAEKNPDCFKSVSDVSRVSIPDYLPQFSDSQAMELLVQPRANEFPVL